jgi:pimeloyl-ACP methyl ester carboxylesterase
VFVTALSAALPASAGQPIGVVFLHGKQSMPEEHIPLADAITAAGFLLARPEMCWSGRRIYDRDYLHCLREIDRAIERLKQRGAAAFVIAGHSLGANGALAYGARHDVRGVIALAPGHMPELRASQPSIAESLARARTLIAVGRGDVRTAFADFNGDLAIMVMATPTAYLSFFAPDSPAVMPSNAARLTAPLLYVVGSDDPFQHGPDYIFARVPPHPLNRYVTVPAGHFATSEAASEVVVAWLRTLAGITPADSARPPPR